LARQLLPVCTIFFLCFFVSIHYEIDVYSLVSCEFIVLCCLIIVMVDNAEDDLGETKQNFVKNPEMSNHLRLKSNQTLMELLSMLKLLNMSTLVSSHFMPTKLTQLGFFQTTLNVKIEKTCLSGHIVKQIRRDLQL